MFVLDWIFHYFFHNKHADWNILFESTLNAIQIYPIFVCSSWPRNFTYGFPVVNYFVIAFNILDVHLAVDVYFISLCLIVSKRIKIKKCQQILIELGKLPTWHFKKIENWILEIPETKCNIHGIMTNGNLHQNNWYLCMWALENQVSNVLVWHSVVLVAE